MLGMRSLLLFLVLAVVLAPVTEDALQRPQLACECQFPQIRCTRHSASFLSQVPYTVLLTWQSLLKVGVVGSELLFVGYFAVPNLFVPGLLLGSQGRG